MSMNWVNYKGKRIIILDYTGMDKVAMLKQMRLYFKEIVNETDVRTLSNFADLLVPKEFRERAKEIRLKNHDIKQSRTALIGINKYQKANVSTYNFHTKIQMQIFDSEKEALDWLASDEQRSLNFLNNSRS